MPELPEVETVVRIVRPEVVGRTIEGVRVPWERTLGGRSRAAFGRAVRGSRISAVWRRAKFLVFDLERGGAVHGWLVAHLRMTGRFFVEPDDGPLDPYARLVLGLDDGRRLVFCDVRKFGRVTYEEDLEERLGDLGPEPLHDEFTSELFVRALRRKRRMLKPLLLDQGFVAGLGNIYVDEALHAARLHPERSADSVPPAAAHALYDAIRKTLAAAIEREGSSFDRFYRTPEGRPGSYQHQFRVYGRDGQPCRRCGGRIAKIVVGQRGTHLCRRCQRAPRRRA